MKPSKYKTSRVYIHRGRHSNWLEVIDDQVFLKIGQHCIWYHPCSGLRFWFTLVWIEQMVKPINSHPAWDKCPRQFVTLTFDYIHIVFCGKADIMTDQATNAPFLDPWNKIYARLISLNLTNSIWHLFETLIIMSLGFYSLVNILKCQH